MLKNIDVVNAFLKRREAENTNMTSTGYKLFSYNTCIAQWENNKIIKNITKYSISTSKHQFYIKNPDIEVSKVPINTTNLLSYVSNESK